jgi:hypothetical protein
MTEDDYEPFVQAAYEGLLAAKTPEDERIACAHFTQLIRARNAARTPEEISRLERERGLR